MAWISVTASRKAFAAQIAQHRAARIASGVTAFADIHVVWAWIGGNEQHVREEVDILMHPTHLTSRMLSRPSETLLLSYAASLLLRRCAGEAVDDELARLSLLKGYRETAGRVVQATLGRILSGQRIAARPTRVGYPETEAAFRAAAEQTPPPLPAQLALVPDGQHWARLGSGVVVPLAYEALAASGAAPDLNDLASFVDRGGDARVRDVVYERTDTSSSGAWRREPTETPGFDAVELTENAVVVHHYMGVRWQAPMMFDEDVNAFQFLAHVDAGWSQVRDSIEDEHWDRLIKARARFPTLHRVSIDAQNACEDPRSTERARKTYGVEVEVVNFLEA